MTGGILQSQGSGKIVVNFPIGNGIYQPTNIVSLSGVNNQSNFEVQGGMLHPFGVQSPIPETCRWFRPTRLPTIPR